MDKALSVQDAKTLLSELLNEYDALIEKRKSLEDDCQKMKSFIQSQVSTIQTITKEIEAFRIEYEKHYRPGITPQQQAEYQPSLQTSQQQMYQQQGAFQQQQSYNQPVQGQETVEQHEQPDEAVNLILLEPEESITHSCNVTLYAEIIDQSVICSTAFSPDGINLAIGSDKIIRVYNLEQDAFVLQGITSNSQNSEQNNHVRSISWTPDSKRVFCGLEDHSIYVFEVSTEESEENNQPIKIINAGEGDVFQVLCFPDGTRFASSTGDGKIKIWDANTYQCLVTYQKSVKSEEDGSISISPSIALSPDGETLAAGYSDSSVVFWNLTTGKKIFDKKCHNEGVYSVLFTPDGKRLITSSLDYTVKIWNVLPGDIELWKTLDKHKEYVLTLSIDPTGKWLISGSKDMSCIITRIDEGRMLYQLKNHENSVITVSFNPNGKLFCSGSGDKYVKIWNFLPDDSDVC
jgi:WD40 repeat protein